MHRCGAPQIIGACGRKGGSQKPGKIVKTFGLFNPVPAIVISSPSNVHTKLLLEGIPELQAKLEIHYTVVFCVTQEYWRVSIAANVWNIAGRGHPAAKANETAQPSTRKHDTDGCRATLADST